MAHPEPEPEPEEALLADDVRAQVEFYFGDANLPKDKFLKKQMAEDPDSQGWVELEVVASFKKMKALAADAGAVAAALAGSELLTVSDDGTRVRRTHPLPKADTSALRTVVAEGLPPSMDLSIEALQAKFGACGEVRMVQVVQAEAQSEAEWAHCKHPAFRGRETLVLAQFGTEAEACDACDQLDEGQNSWRGGMRVSLLQKNKVFKKRQSEKRQAEKAEREARKEAALAQPQSRRPSGLAGIAEPAEGAAAPKERPRLRLTKRGAATATAKKPKPAAAQGEPASEQPEEAILLAKGPDGTSGFAARWRAGHPWLVDGVEKRVDPSDGVAYSFEDFDAVYGAAAGATLENAQELWNTAGVLMKEAAAKARDSGTQ